MAHISKNKSTKKPAPEPQRRKPWSTETIKYLTQVEMRLLLAEAKESKRDYTLFLLAYRHGLRASEVGLLEINDIDFARHKIHLHRLKRSVSGVHPMRPDEVKAVKAYLKTRSDDNPTLFLSRIAEPISRRQLDHLIKDYGKLAGLPQEKQHFHCLKHSIATHHLDAGADIRFVQDWIGHASITNTTIYAQLTNRRRDEEARRLALSRLIV